MPHISALQDQYSEKVQFIGITDEDAPTVDAFMNRQATEAGQNWSEMLTYTIARDQGTETGAAWMQAAARTQVAAGRQRPCSRWRYAAVQHGLFRTPGRVTTISVAVHQRCLSGVVPLWAAAQSVLDEI